MTPDDKARILDLVRRVLDEIGHDCSGVQYAVDLVPMDGGMLAPAVILKWDPSIHPKTLYDPAQAIVLENLATGRLLKDETLRREIREKIERMLRVDQHAHKEMVDLGSARRDLAAAALKRVHSIPTVTPGRVSDPRTT